MYKLIIKYLLSEVTIFFSETVKIEPFIAPAPFQRTTSSTDIVTILFNLKYFQPKQHFTHIPQTQLSISGINNIYFWGKANTDKKLSN